MIYRHTSDDGLKETLGHFVYLARREYNVVDHAINDLLVCANSRLPLNHTTMQLHVERIKRVKNNQQWDIGSINEIRADIEYILKRNNSSFVLKFVAEQAVCVIEDLETKRVLGLERWDALYKEYQTFPFA